MDTKTIVMCVVALLLGMLISNMLKDVCGCKNIVEGQTPEEQLASESTCVNTALNASAAPDECKTYAYSNLSTAAKEWTQDCATCVNNSVLPNGTRCEPHDGTTRVFCGTHSTPPGDDSGDDSECNTLCSVHSDTFTNQDCINNCKTNTRYDFLRWLIKKLDFK